MKNFSTIILSIAVFGLIPDSASACATCFGDPSAPASQGMNWAIITLLGITGSVLGAVIHTIVTISRKSKKFNQLNKR
jgi:hypothetical protein